LKYGRPIVNQTIEIKDSVVVKASATLNGLKMNTDTLRNTALTIDANTSLTNIKFNRIYGKISPNIPVEEVLVNLTNLPKMLKDNRDSIIFDVKPYLDLVMNTNLQIPFGATVILKPYKNGEVIAEGEQQVSIQVPASLGAMTATKFWIADSNAKMPTGQGYQFVKADLGAVVKRIPDSIRISVDANTDPNAQAIFDLNTPYSTNLNYQFVVPLAFGPSLQIVIQDTIKDLNSLVGKLLSGNQISLTGTMWNSIPLDLEATVIPIDSNNNAIDIASLEKLVIKSGDATGAAVQSNFELTFNDPNKRLQNLSGFIFKFNGQTGTNTAGIPIKPDNFIKAKLSAKIVDGIVIDLNDLKK
jgi:hypothetical protein